MSAPYIIPFNHQPVNTGNTSSYTVPSGKYARVIINLKASAWCTQNDSFVTGFSGIPGASISCEADSKSHNVELWLKAGDSISFALQNATGSASISRTFQNSTGGIIFDAATSESIAVAFYNGFEVASISAFAQASASIGATFIAGTVSVTYATFAGASSGLVFYEEYNVIS